MEIHTLIEKAQQYSESQGGRFTTLRQTIYKLMLEADGAVGAYHLLDQLKQTEGSAKPATIYRSLDFLLEHGLIHKVESNNTFIACRHFGCHHPVQFLICDLCGNVQEIQSEGISATLETQAKSIGFKIESQTIEAHGVCARCH
jgi:Fur family zinc uptake transcriptional regulator